MIVLMRGSMILLLSRYYIKYNDSIYKILLKDVDKRKIRRRLYYYVKITFKTTIKMRLRSPDGVVIDMTNNNNKSKRTVIISTFNDFLDLVKILRPDLNVKVSGNLINWVG